MRDACHLPQTTRFLTLLLWLLLLFARRFALLACFCYGLPWLFLHDNKNSAGSFRDVFVAETDHDQLVFKESSYENAHGRYNYKDFHFVRKDGVIAAQLQPHPLIVDTYGWCQLSLFGEYMPMVRTVLRMLYFVLL